MSGYGDGLYGSGDYGEAVALAAEPYNQFAEPVIDAMDAVMTDNLATYIRALGQQFEEVEDLARDTSNGQVGWSVIVDLDRIDNKGLPYIAQFLGTGVMQGIPDEQQRERIKAETNLARGTVSQIMLAARLHLTGNKTVIFRERDAAACAAEPAYGLTIITYDNETPDPNLTLSDIMAQKPAGIVLRYVVATGQDYEQLWEHYSSYQSVFNNYTSYQGVVEDKPGT
jgi:hypothetical protein